MITTLSIVVNKLNCTSNKYLIDWQYRQDDGEWRDLKVPNTDPNILHTFTLNLTIIHGERK